MKSPEQERRVRQLWLLANCAHVRRELPFVTEVRLGASDEERFHPAEENGAFVPRVAGRFELEGGRSSSLSRFLEEQCLLFR